MENLLNEAKEIIEMSLSAQTDTDAYSAKANEWLAKVKSAQQTEQALHTHDSATSCAMCGNDLICPSCQED